MARARSAGGGGLSWRVIVAVALVVVVGFLVFRALAVSAGSETNVPVGAPPTFVDASPQGASQTPRPSASPSASPGAGVDGVSATRFVTATSPEQVWRVDSPRCSANEAVGVDFSDDGGDSWQPVDFGSFDVREVLSVGAVNANAVFMVVATGADCEPSVLRSFTQGASWTVSEAGLPTLRYIDPVDRSVTVTLSTPGSSACDNPAALDYSATVAAELCEGEVFVSDDSGWQDSGLSDVVALSFAGDDLLVARVGAESCEGTQVARAADGDVDALETVTCFDEAVAQPGSAAVGEVGGDVVLWAGRSWYRAAV